MCTLAHELHMLCSRTWISFVKEYMHAGTVLISLFPDGGTNWGSNNEPSGIHMHTHAYVHTHTHTHTHRQSGAHFNTGHFNTGHFQPQHTQWRRNHGSSKLASVSLHTCSTRGAHTIRTAARIRMPSAPCAAGHGVVYTTARCTWIYTCT